MKTIDDFAYDVRDELSRQRLGYVSYYAIVAIIRILFEEIEKTVDAGEEVNIPKFGKFKKKLSYKKEIQKGKDRMSVLYKLKALFFCFIFQMNIWTEINRLDPNVGTSFALRL